MPDAALLQSFGRKLAVVDAQLKKASAAWQERVWAHTLATTTLEETLDSKHAMSGALVGVLAGIEATKHAMLVELWQSITLADLDWQNQ